MPKRDRTVSQLKIVRKIGLTGPNATAEHPHSPTVPLHARTARTFPAASRDGSNRVHAKQRFSRTARKKQGSLAWQQTTWFGRFCCCFGNANTRVYLLRGCPIPPTTAETETGRCGDIGHDATRTPMRAINVKIPDSVSDVRQNQRSPSSHARPLTMHISYQEATAREKHGMVDCNTGHHTH